MSSCDGCKCFVVQTANPVEPTIRRPGLIALVFDAPDTAIALGRSPFNGAGGEILEATIRAVIRMQGRTPPEDILDEVATFYAVSRPTPGNKPPRISAVRACKDRLIDELDHAQPSAVLSLGAAACSALSGTGAATPITKWRGMMRWLELPSGARVPWVPTINPNSVAGKTDYYRDFSYDVWKVWTQPAPMEAPDIATYVPRDFDALRGNLALLDDASVISCDIETTGFGVMTKRIISVGFGADYGDNSGIAVIVPVELLDDPRVQDICWDYVYRASRRTVGQNFKFDLQFLMRWWGETRVEHHAMLGDTLLLGSLLDERPKKDRIGSLGLKEQAMVRYDKPDYHWDWEKFYADMAHDGYFGWECDKARCKHPHPDDEPRADIGGMYAYQAMDVYYTARLWFDLVDEANAESPRLLDAHEQVMVPAMKVLAGCELRGAPLDLEWLDRFAKHLRRRITRRERALLALVDEVELGSPAQIADLMYDVWGMTPDMRKKKYKDGVLVEDRSTDKDHIEAAIAKYWKSQELGRAARWLRTLLRWRGDTKQLSTYSETLVDKADDAGRVHAEFLLHGTMTGRLSAKTPNLQNIPAVDKREIVDGRPLYTLRGAKTTHWPARRGFAPRPGYVWVEADYSQLELRVAAWLSGDEGLRDVFVNERDIHREVAATMFSKPPEAITKPERYLAKAVDFGILYGRQGKAIAAGEEMDYAERELGMKRWDAATADAFIAKFLRGYPKLSRWLTDNAAKALTEYHVETPFGRRRRFPLKPRTSWERMRIERQANNTPIQSAASDICIQAMARIEPLLPEGADLMFPVHDSICLEVREDLVEDVRAICKAQMEVVLPGGVPLTIDFEFGESWADTH